MYLICESDKYNYMLFAKETLYYRDVSFPILVGFRFYSSEFFF